MRAFVLLIGVLLYSSFSHLRAEVVAPHVQGAAAADEVQLSPELIEKLQRLESELVGPVAYLDYPVAEAAIAEFGVLDAGDIASVGSYSRMTVLGFPSAAVPQVDFADGVYWMLQAPLTYRPGNAQAFVVVPTGFVHDFASVPGLATPFVPAHGPYNRAAIVHDFLYWAHPCSRLQADNLFLISMIEAGVSPVRRWGIYAAVRLGGWAAWSNNQSERQQRLPRVVPDEHLPFSADETWVSFRRALFERGVRDDVSVDDTGFCALGDSTSVPTELLAEASGGVQ